MFLLHELYPETTMPLFRPTLIIFTWGSASCCAYFIKVLPITWSTLISWLVGHDFKNITHKSEAKLNTRTTISTGLQGMSLLHLPAYCNPNV
jgi:hypothetical protein